MKKTIYMIIAALAIISCGDRNGGKNPELTLEEKLCGEWHSASLPLDGDIYISFASGRTFELYQQIGEGAYRLYRGEWNLEENLLTGKYNDGEDWAASYAISIDGNSLTLTSRNDAAEVSQFTRQDIPESVINGCEIIVKGL